VNPKNFFAELKRRNVYKVAIAYAVVAWLLMQIASQIFPFFEIPNWAVRLVVLLLACNYSQQRNSGLCVDVSAWIKRSLTPNPPP
jgi:hypothetical protein